MATDDYTQLATLVVHVARAAGALVLILGGDRGTGFSVDVPPDLYPGLPSLLRHMADDVQADVERTLSATNEDSLICGGCGRSLEPAEMRVLPGVPKQGIPAAVRCSRCLGEEAPRG